MKKVSVGIICREFNGLKKYLLICSLKNYGEFTGYYYPSGGHVEEGEDSMHAVIREIREELGIEA